MKRYTKQSRTRRTHKSRKGTRKGMRGGGVKEDALRVIKNKKKDVEQFHIDVLQGTYSNPVTLDGIVFKSAGHVNLVLMAKKEGTSDSTFVEIHTMSDH